MNVASRRQQSHLCKKTTSYSSLELSLEQLSAVILDIFGELCNHIVSYYCMGNLNS